MISAKVIADSKNEFGNRLTTMIVTMPRIILAEFNTHRMFSRNSASSRAIPFNKMVESVIANPFIPIAWQKDHKGMQGNEYFNEEDSKINVDRWLFARDRAVDSAISLNVRKVTKQLANRMIEPFMWHTVIISATEFSNFFELRCPKYSNRENKTYRSWRDITQDYLDLEQDASILTRLSLNKGQAEIHMMALAEAMWDAYNESTPKQLKAGEWHIPFGDDIKPETYEGYRDWSERAIKIATARCAQVSYTVIGEEGKPLDYAKLIALHDRLAKSGHWSPFEHCAKVMPQYLLGEGSSEHSKWSGNFKGFIQYRKMFKNENITTNK